MKNKGLFKFVHIIALVLGGIFLWQGIKVYSQGIDINYKNTVDNNMTLVHNFKDYIELTGKARQGITGYILYLNSGESMIMAMPYLDNLVQRGYNVYIVKNNDYSEIEKLKIGKNIVKREKENINWIINYRDKEKYVLELEEWMINKGYRAKIIEGYFNSFEDMSKNKDLGQINNELNILRNKI